MKKLKYLALLMLVICVPFVLTACGGSYSAGYDEGYADGYFDGRYDNDVPLPPDYLRFDDSGANLIVRWDSVPGVSQYTIHVTLVYEDDYEFWNEDFWDRGNFTSYIVGNLDALWFDGVIMVIASVSTGNDLTLHNFSGFTLFEYYFFD